LPSGRDFTGHLLAGIGVFDIVEYLGRHDLAGDWLLFGVGAGFTLLGLALVRTTQEPVIERRSGYDRRSDSPLR
jgi:hypothetical protein